MNHWHEWKYAAHYSHPPVSKHRVAVMVEAERRGYDDFKTTKVGRTFCGVPIRHVSHLNPHPPQMDALEAWTMVWRPCYRCFPAFDRRTYERMTAIDHRWSEKGERQMERVDHLLWNVVMKHRASSGGKR